MRTRRFILAPWNPDPGIIGGAADVLRHGGLVAFPTETVYGLGADALNPEAVKKIFAAKGRPSDNPLILHLSRPEQAGDLVELDERAERLMAEFWPGPLTLVLRAKPIIPTVTRGGLDTAALRMPAHPVALALIEATGRPLAAPSANVSGRPSPTDAQTVWEDMEGRIEMILDGGDTRVGIESTVIDVSAPGRAFLLRPGGTPKEVLEDFLGTPLGTPERDSPRRSPGMRYRHYAPSIPVKIWRPGEPVEPLLDGGDVGEWGFMGLCVPPARFGHVLRFDSIESYARSLFAGFRSFESETETGEWKGIVAEWPPETGVGLGLRDRIWRAAAEGQHGV